MDETTGLAAVDAVFRSAARHGYEVVKLKYAGGEATLNLPVLERLHAHAVDLAGRQGVALRAVVLTNGVVLRPALLDWVRECGIRLSISLDGSPAAHDAHRRSLDGRGTHARVVRSIDAAIAYGVHPSLSITVTAESAPGVADAVAFALDRELPFNLNFYREHDTGAGTTVDTESLRAADERLIDGVRAAFERIAERVPRQRLIDALIDRSAFSHPHAHACGAGHDYLVINHHGRVARCHMEIERTITDVLAPDPLAVVRASPHGFANLPVAEKEGCRDCAWRHWCAGGCPLLTYRVTGRADVKSPYCYVYKALYPDVVRLEGLRLLKWATPPGAREA